MRLWTNSSAVSVKKWISSWMLCCSASRISLFFGQCYGEYAVDAEENGPAITAQIYINILQKDVDNDFPQGMVLFRAVVQTITKAQLADEVGNMQPAEEIAYALYHGLRSVAYTWSSCGGSFSLIGGYKRIFQVILAPKLPKEQVFGTDA